MASYCVKCLAECLVVLLQEAWRFDTTGSVTLTAARWERGKSRGCGVAAGRGRWETSGVRSRGAGAKRPFKFPIRQAITYGPLITGQPTPAHVVTGHAATLAVLCPSFVPLGS